MTSGPSATQVRASQLAESSRYPYKGRSNDSMVAPTGERYVSRIPAPRAAAASVPQAGKLTPGFGELGQSCKQKGSPTMLGTADSGSRATAMVPWPVSPTMLDVTDCASRATETASVCDDEPEFEVCNNSDSERESDDDSCVPTIGSQSCASRGPVPVSNHQALKPKSANSLVGTESSTGSNCSTPRSLDTESVPWQEGPHSSSASSASGAPRPWVEGTTSSAWASNHVVPAGEGAEADAESDDLQAEVRQLLLQYKLDKLDKERARPEVGSAQQRQPKESCGPELSCKSAWIHPDKLAAQET